MLHYRITTPEQVHFRYQIAGLGSRGLAWATDQCLLILVLLVLGIPVGALGAHVGYAALILGKFLLDFGYFTYFELYRHGQTPGKKLFRIRVMSSLGGRLRFSDAIVRTMFRVLDNPALIPFVGVVGALSAALDPLQRRLGDLAADTIVVRDVDIPLGAQLPSQQARVNSFQEDPAIRTRVLARATREERDLVFDLMLRRDSIGPARREALFQEAAEYFRRRFGLPEPQDYLSDEQTVLNLAMVMQKTKVTA